jgi:S-methylmethionine-dependent homocysteine/selenocysteine methylase
MFHWQTVIFFLYFDLIKIIHVYLVNQVHMDYLEAGANILITASYQVPCCKHSTFQLHVMSICQ